MSETTRKTYKFKLKPTPDQERLLLWTRDRCRELYNAALQERRDAWRMRGISLSFAHQSAELPGVKEVRPEYQDIHSQVLQDVLHRLDNAFQAFFRRVKSGEKPGYPRFQGVNRYHSFTYPQYDNGAKFDNGVLVLSKIGRIAVRWSRKLEGIPKTVTLSQEADGWYVCVSCESVPTEPLPLTGKEIGIDVGLAAFLTTSEGEKVANPRYLREAETDLKKAQRRVSRGKKGSHRRKKKVKVLAKQHQTVRRKRRDFFFKLALDLVRRYDVIVYEDLEIRNLVKNHHLAKSISDAGWGEFLAILACKADPAWAGTGRQDSDRGAASVHEPGLFALRRARPQEPERADAWVPALWVGHGSGRKRGAEHPPTGRAGPSGTRGATCGSEPRIPPFLTGGVSSSLLLTYE